MKKSAKRHGKGRKEKSLAARQMTDYVPETNSKLARPESRKNAKKTSAKGIAMMTRVADAIEKFSAAIWVIGVYQNDVIICRIGLVSFLICLLITWYLHKEDTQ
jgi:hypothetical protein